MRLATCHYAKDQIRFNRGHIYITVHVRGNHSIREDFAPEAGGTFSDAQIRAILEDNAKGYHWDTVGETTTKVNLIRTDGHAPAEVAKPNYQADEGRIKLTTTGAELIISARPWPVCCKSGDLWVLISVISPQSRERSFYAI